MGVPHHPIKASVITVDQTLLVEAELRRRRRNKILIWIGLGVTLIATLAIAVATPMVMKMGHGKPQEPQRGPSRTTAIIPLYIYPEKNSWAPLYKAISGRKDLDFLVIINPHNGPGESELPNDLYTSEIKKLNGYSNVQTIGYVQISRTFRNISAVIGDIEKYSAWASKHSLLAMSGIFFDEAPSVYSNATVDYLERINLAAKEATGLQGNRTVVHNPGQVPDTRLRGSHTDIQVILENSYEGYTDPALQTGLQTVEGYPSWYSYMVHSVPSGVDVPDLIKQITQHAQYVFVTDLSTTYYEHFGSIWDSFINSMPA